MVVHGIPLPTAIESRRSALFNDASHIAKDQRPADYVISGGPLHGRPHLPVKKRVTTGGIWNCFSEGRRYAAICDDDQP